MMPQGTFFTVKSCVGGSTLALAGGLITRSVTQSAYFITTFTRDAIGKIEVAIGALVTKLTREIFLALANTFFFRLTTLKILIKKIKL